MGSQIYKKVLWGVPSMSTVESSDIAYVEIIEVKREGAVCFEMPVLPGNAEYFYEIGMGRLWFDSTNPFRGRTLGDRPVPLSQRERIFVIYKLLT